MDEYKRNLRLFSFAYVFDSSLKRNLKERTWKETLKETYGFSLTLPLKERTWRETFWKGSLHEHYLNHAY
jgi:hypothetical protein